MIRKNPDKMYVRELRNEIVISRQVMDSQYQMIKERDAEIERLKSIDRALYDYKHEIAKAEYKQFQREGFEEVEASRRFQRLLKQSTASDKAKGI